MFWQLRLKVDVIKVSGECDRMCNFTMKKAVDFEARFTSCDGRQLQKIAERARLPRVGKISRCTDRATATESRENRQDARAILELEILG